MRLRHPPLEAIHLVAQVVVEMVALLLERELVVPPVEDHRRAEPDVQMLTTRQERLRVVLPEVTNSHREAVRIARDDRPADSALRACRVVRPVDEELVIDWLADLAVRPFQPTCRSVLESDAPRVCPLHKRHAERQRLQVGELLGPKHNERVVDAHHRQATVRLDALLDSKAFCAFHIHEV